MLLVSHQMPPAEGITAYWCGYDTVTIEDVADRTLQHLEAQLEEFSFNLAEV